METKQAEEMMNTMDIENQYSKVDVSIPLQNLFDECLNLSLIHSSEPTRP